MTERRLPPHELRTPRLRLRCWRPDDAPLYKDAVGASLDELRLWIDWADREPTSVEAKVALLQRFRGLFDLGHDFQYGIFDLATDALLGSAGMHARVGPDVFELGYWIRSDQAGKGYATETVAALTKTGFELCSAARVEVHIAVGNDASVRVVEKLAFPLEAMLPRRMPPLRPGEPPRDELLFTLFADGYASTPSASVEVEAYDAAGTRVVRGARNQKQPQP